MRMRTSAAWGKWVRVCTSTWLGALVHCAVPDLMGKLWSVVVHVDDIDDYIDGIFHLIAVNVYSMSAQLEQYTYTSSGHTTRTCLASYTISKGVGQKHDSVLILISSSSATM